MKIIKTTQTVLRVIALKFQNLNIGKLSCFFIPKFIDKKK